jgi:hypothetical protein
VSNIAEKQIVMALKCLATDDMARMIYFDLVSSKGDTKAGFDRRP